MDTALELRILFENKTAVTNEQINTMLLKSKLIQKLTQPIDLQPLSAIFLLSGLSEIPHVEHLPFTQQVINYCKKHVATVEGFAYTGKVRDIVPCYNAISLEAFARLGLTNSLPAQAALNWIKKNQLFDRELKTPWSYDGICKHGGCLKSTPCYIGIGKTVRSLITYQEFSKQKDPEVDELIQKGTAYMLKHQMYLRLSKPQPVSPHITDAIFPQNYFLSLTDLVYIIGKTKNTTHPNAQKFLSLLKEKEVAENKWKLDYIYKYKGYYAFETRRKPSEWLSYLYPLWLANN